MLREGLEVCRKTVTDIATVIVDTGPGGTSRVRTGIAFANGLAYGLGVPVIPVSSMELAGRDAGIRFNLPVITSVKSIKGNAYVGLFQHNELTMNYGKIEDTVPCLTEDLSAFAVVGFHRKTIMELPSLQCKTIIDSELLYGNARIFIERYEIFRNRGLIFPEYVRPITEQTLPE
jgi:tRNA threonylcarbamoyladenosine biosynthesis protein TsaB